MEAWPVQERRNIVGGEGLPGRYRNCRSHLGHFSSSSKNVQKTVKKGHFCNNFPQILVQMKVSFHFMVRSAIFLSFKWLVSLFCIIILCTRLTDMISMSLWLDFESDTAQMMARLHFYHSFMTITVSEASLYRSVIDEQHVFERYLVVTLKMSQLNYNWRYGRHHLKLILNSLQTNFGFHQPVRFDEIGWLWTPGPLHHFKAKSYLSGSRKISYSSKNVFL